MTHNPRMGKLFSPGSGHVGASLCRCITGVSHAEARHFPEWLSDTELLLTGVQLTFVPLLLMIPDPAKLQACMNAGPGPQPPRPSGFPGSARASGPPSGSQASSGVPRPVFPGTVASSEPHGSHG